MPYPESDAPRTGERGAISIKALISLVLAAVALFVIVKVAPVYWDEQQIKHQVDELARMTANQTIKPERVNKRIEEIKDEFKLPADSITMTSSANQMAQFALKYSVTIEFFVTSYVWKVDYVTVGKGL